MAASDTGGSTCDNAAPDLGSCLARIHSEWPDLAVVVEAWATLPEAIVKAIMALVEAAAKAS